MKTLKKMTLALCFATVGIAAIAQQPQKGVNKEQRMENIKQHKIAYITEKLQLTSEEAQTFWPVYNEFQNQKQALRKEHKAKFKDHKSIDEMSDKEVEEMLNDEMVFRSKQFEMEKANYLRMKQVLPIHKVAKLYKAEKTFKRKMLEQLKDGEHKPYTK